MGVANVRNGGRSALCEPTFPPRRLGGPNCASGSQMQQSPRYLVAALREAALKSLD